MRRKLSRSKAPDALLVMAALVGLSPKSASAQIIDYGSLEQMFGEPVTASATGKPQIAGDAPANLIIITAEEIRRSGAVSIADIPSMVLKNYPGIDVQQASMGVANVGINGYDQPYSPRLLVLVDGRQVYLDIYGSTEWSAIPVELAEIRQIEVVKGPNSALFGFNATNGVINIVTINPLHDQVREVSTTVGTQDYRAGSAVMTARPADGVGVKLSFGGDLAHQFDGWDNSLQKASRPNRASVSGEILSQLTDGTEVSLEATRNIANVNDILQNYSGDQSCYALWSVKAGLTTDSRLGAISVWTYHNALALDNQSENFRVHHENDVTSVQVSDLYRLDPYNALREAVEFRKNEYRSDVTGGGTVDYDVLSDSLMWDWQVAPHLSWTNAGRVDYLTLSRSGTLPASLGLTNSFWKHDLTAYSYNSGAVYKPSDSDTLRLTVAQAVEAPSLLGYGVVGSLGADSTALVGDPRTKPTVVRNYQVGYVRNLRDWGVDVTTAVYRQYTRDVTSLVSSSQLAAGSSYALLSGNVGNSRETGVEFGLAYKADPDLRLDANYTFADIADSISIDVPSQPSAALMPGGGQPGGWVLVHSPDGSPTHKINLHAGFDLGGWEVDGYGHYVSRIFQQSYDGSGTQYERIPGYVELDLRLARALTDRLGLAITGTSVDLARHREDVGPGVQRRVLATLNAKF